MTKWRKSPPELIEHLFSATSALPGVEPRKMFGYPCCFVNGNMFTGLHQESWIIRLGEGDRSAMIRDYDTTVFEATPGRPMTQYIVLPDVILNDEELLIHWLKKSFAYARELAPKHPRKAVKKY